MSFAELLGLESRVVLVGVSANVDPTRQLSSDIWKSTAAWCDCDLIFNRSCFFPTLAQDRHRPSRKLGFSWTGSQNLKKLP